MCSDSAFYATQYGKECWCGSTDDYDKNGPNSLASCDVNCADNAAEKCGGTYYASVYSNDGVEPVDPVDPVTDPSYIGCFGDDQAARVFDLGVKGDVDMTTEVGGDGFS